MQDLVREVDPNEQLDEEVEELLLQIADDFIESTVNASCQLAKHRQASALDVTDVQMHLGTNCNSFNIFFIHLLYQNRAAMEHVAPGLRNRRVATVQTGTCNRSTQAANGLDKKANKKVLIVE